MKLLILPTDTAQTNDQPAALVVPVSPLEIQCLLTQIQGLQSFLPAQVVSLEYDLGCEVRAAEQSWLEAHVPHYRGQVMLAELPGDTDLDAATDQYTPTTPLWKIERDGVRLLTSDKYAFSNETYVSMIVSKAELEQLLP